MHGCILLKALSAAAMAVAVAATPALAQNNKGGSGGSTGGVTVIDQARAEAGGVTSSDAPGFPVTLSQPGSYRLMSDLIVPAPTLSAVVVTSPNVTLDLNGFSIRGPVSCSGVGPSLACTSDGLDLSARGHGVQVTDAAGEPSVVVRNGSISRMSGLGIAGSGHTHVDRVQLIHNGMGGAAGLQTLTNSTVWRNRGTGVYAFAVAIGNVVTGNRSYGMWQGRGRHNNSSLNGLDDFYVTSLLD